MRKFSNLSLASNVRFGTLTLIGIALIYGLMLFEAVSYPVSVRGDGLGNLVITVAALLVYAVAAFWVRQMGTGALQVVLAQGGRIGAVLGIVEIVNLALEHFTAFPPMWNAVRGAGMWALMFLAFGIAGSAAFEDTGSIRCGLLCSVWSSMVSTVGAICFGFALPAVFMPHMVTILAPAFAQSGMTDAHAFVVRNTFDAAVMHLLIAPLVALMFGLAGGCAGFLLKSIRPRVALFLAVFEILLLACGVAAIRFASYLDRSERGPFILFGLLALGVGMASAHSIFRAIRRPVILI